MTKFGVAEAATASPLVLDLNGDGVIDNQSELFSNGDGKITAADAQFANLRVWVDSDSDGVTDAGELKTLASLGITSINTNYTNVNYTIGDTPVKQESTFVMNGVSRQVVDAWFNYSNVNTEDTRAYTLDIRTLFLPTLRGYGNMADQCRRA